MTYVYLQEGEAMCKVMIRYIKIILSDDLNQFMKIKSLAYKFSLWIGIDYGFGEFNKLIDRI